MERWLVPALGLLLLPGCAPERDCSTVLWYTGQASAVSVVGDFNGWNPDTDPMHRYEDAWRIQLHLDPGDYAYLLEVDGEQMQDPHQPLLQWDASLDRELSLLRVPSCQEPELELVEAEATADGSLSVSCTFLRAEGGARLDADTVEARLHDGTALEEVQARPGSGSIAVQARDLPEGKHTVLLAASDRQGLGAELRVPLWVEPEPFSWEDALIYQVVTDRFAGPEGELEPLGTGEKGARAGGNLAGLLSVMRDGYFEELGVGALWISPVYENPEGEWEGLDGEWYEGYHGYWPVSWTDMDPAQGASEDLEALVSEAHERGIRVLLDVVPNHTHLEHPWYTDHPDRYHEDPDCICGEYDCPWSEDIETCWFTGYLPDLALERTEVARAVAEETAWWAETYDLDGYRVDAVPMMPRAAVRELVWRFQDLEQGPTRFYTVGETYTGSDDYGDIRVNLGPFGLDGQFEFPIMWAIRDWLAWDSGDASALEQALAESYAAWEGSGSIMAPFVGNHDVTRFISEAAGDDTTDPWGDPPPQPEEDEPYRRLLAAQALAFTLPGAPVLYYGDEVGLAGAGDPDCRRTMVFEPDGPQSWLRERMGRLGRARQCSEALRHGERLPLVADGLLYAHLRDAGRGDDGEAGLALTAINASEQSRTLTFVLPPECSVDDPQELVDALEAEAHLTLREKERITLEIPALTARVFVGGDCVDQPGRR